MNKAIFIGRICNDFELKQGSESMYCGFTLAINRRFEKDKADFVVVKCFGKLAEFCFKYFKKGQQVSVIGWLKTGSYEKKDGTKVYTTEVICEEAYFAEGKK